MYHRPRDEEEEPPPLHWDRGLCVCVRTRLCVCTCTCMCVYVYMWSHHTEHGVPVWLFQALPGETPDADVLPSFVLNCR